MSHLQSGPEAAPPWRGSADRERAVLVIHLVAFATGVPAREIAAPGRCAATVADARQLAMYLAATGFSWTLARVGAAFGRDRSTVSHACRRVEDRRDDPAFDARVDELEACLRAAPAGGTLLA